MSGGVCGSACTAGADAGLARRDVLVAAVGGALGLSACGQAVTDAPGGYAGTHPERGHLLRDAAPGAASHPISSAAPASGPATVRRTRVLIVGGGIAGLAAARALRQRGIDDFALLELEDEAGGNSRAGMLGGLACPLGAHYLPVPGDDAPAVQALLEELGLRWREAGRWRYDERHLCHSPQERLFMDGAWQEGLLPLQGVGAATLAQYARFAQRVRQAQQAARFSLPAPRGTLAPAHAAHAALDSITFATWLAREGLHDAHLLWYLDYCCRDDYGAGVQAVSAWAGLHYFASRHGFHAPEPEGGAPAAAGERDAVLTWPEGNGWLTQRLAAPLGPRLHTGRVVTRIEAGRHGVEVQTRVAATDEVERWQAPHCVVALPAHVVARVVAGLHAPLQAAAGAVRHAPWLVANIHLREPLPSHRGDAAPAWDNVIRSGADGSTGLGYVDASHQRLNPTPGPTVLTWYCAPGAAARGDLLRQPWTHWQSRALAELSPAHPELAALATHWQLTRYGHAMAVPEPGARTRLAALPLHAGRLHFAHSDWAGYSVFEEAFTLGDAAGHRLARLAHGLARRA